MVKRSIAGVLWLLATWFAYDLVAYFTGIPRIGGPVLGVILGLAVFLDPLRLIWSAETPRQPASDDVARSTAPGITPLRDAA